MLEDEDIREREGREMEILNLSTLKSISNLQKYHEYNNNEIDRPFLTPESVMLDTENLGPT